MRELLRADSWRGTARSPRQPTRLVKKHFDELEQAYAALKPEQDYVPPIPSGRRQRRRASAQTGVPLSNVCATSTTRC